MLHGHLDSGVDKIIKPVQGILNRGGYQHANKAIEMARRIDPVWRIRVAVQIFVKGGRILLISFEIIHCPKPTNSRLIVASPQRIHSEIVVPLLSRVSVSIWRGS